MPHVKSTVPKERTENIEKACKEYNIFQDTIKRMEKELKFGVITEDQFLEWLEQQ